MLFCGPNQSLFSHIFCGNCQACSSCIAFFFCSSNLVEIRSFIAFMISKFDNFTPLSPKSMQSERRISSSACLINSCKFLTTKFAFQAYIISKSVEIAHINTKNIVRLENSEEKKKFLFSFDLKNKLTGFVKRYFVSQVKKLVAKFDLEEVKFASSQSLMIQ